MTDIYRAKAQRLIDQIETLPCPRCDQPFAACRCDALHPPKPIQPPTRQMRTTAPQPRRTAAQAPRQPRLRVEMAKPVYLSESHKLLACRHCGEISCRCTVAAPPNTLDEVLRVQRQRP
jgi:hypothetical protein